MKIMGYEEKTWEEFQKAGLLWWVNRVLHLFGWVIVFETGKTVKRVFPVRCTYRGFEQLTEEGGFIALTEHLHETVPQLLREVHDDSGA
jgi:hypothetical protein